VNEKIVHREGTAVHGPAPRNHSQSPGAIAVAETELLDLGLGHLLVGLDIKVARDIRAHRKIRKPGADATIPVEQ